MQKYSTKYIGILTFNIFIVLSHHGMVTLPSLVLPLVKRT